MSRDTPIGPVETKGGTLLVSDCNYSPVSMFMFNSLHNYEYMNLVFTYDVMNHLNYILDVPLSILYKSLFNKYTEIYPNLVLPWTFNQIVELYVSYTTMKVSPQTGGSIMPSETKPAETKSAETKPVETNVGSMSAKTNIDIEVLKGIISKTDSKPTATNVITIPYTSSKSFFYDLKKKFFITDNALQMRHINIQLDKFKELSNSFDTFSVNIKGGNIKNLSKDEQFILDIIKKERTDINIKI